MVNMPARVDHQERRAQIAGAAVDLVATRGVEAVTMRAVAHAACVSLRLVQYYFGSKQQLLNAALEHVAADSQRRWHVRWAAAVDRPDRSRAVLEAYVEEALPTDAPSRRFHIVFRAFATAAMTDDELDGAPLVAAVERVRARLVDVLVEAGGDGPVMSGFDPGTAATELMALEHGLATGVLMGLHTGAVAADILRRHLERILHP